MAVIAPAGVVGRVVVPSARAAKVQLLIDRNAAAGALIERSRAQGVVVGERRRPAAAGVRVRSRRRRGRRHRRDLGHRRHLSRRASSSARVEAVEKSGGAYRQITVEPAVDFSTLEEVLVVLTPTPAQDAGAGDRTVKTAGVVVATALALALQTTWRGFSSAAPSAVDLVLVVVVYAALTFGPVDRPADRDLRRAGPGRPVERRHRHRRAGEDAWSGSWPASSARSSSSRSRCRGSWCSLRATRAARGVFIGLYELLDLRHFGAPYAAVAGQAVGNAVVGVVAFQLVEFLPGAVERRRAAGQARRLRR